MKPRLIVILGPTAVGKTELAIKWAHQLGGEIISADSMQVYRYLDIGTAKPSLEIRKRIPHHLIDVVNPDEPFNAARFVQEADRIIRRLVRAEKPIFVVGGTGLYIRSLLRGLIESPPRDEQLRQLLRQKENIYEMLKEFDPLAAEKIHPRDRVRIVRALEVFLLTGESIVSKQLRHRFEQRKYDYVKIGIMEEKGILFDLIDKRTQHMFAQGLVEEVKKVLSMGYGKELPPLQTLGYRHAIRLWEGEISREEAINFTARDTRHYAKRQLTWFKKEKDILWFKRDDQAARDTVLRFLEGNLREIP
ncbi:MAG TPA: tRNA (adenosine(37)-N6)-dimethylallyltransferase MiaA [Syntrophales bacterium]|nr:tRNA (adenosine(37)-N6)-dimethylallyltransferase MiaA [Syntrophales bacterium]HOL58675.1 tRNA (adenosine(37)-N6)-dimethylallyltransferase MiaA [Syntrophales bacterium]HPO35037.1 tRNA (adenosine(37)-N6)-dimethylallyltransferase MiaA [Syntrophales bacterium]